ncbi:MAG: photosystem II protein PsbQ [Cyanobacteria bacterium P01_E01_bin.6]
MFDSQRYRTFLSLVLAIATVFIVGCSSGTPEKPPAYTQEQINLIEQYQADLEGLRNRVDELPALIDKKDWTNVRNLIHGPLGELRIKMLTITRRLSSSDQTIASNLSSDVFKSLVAIDEAAAEQSQLKAVSGYNRLIDAYKKFIDTIPDDA